MKKAAERVARSFFRMANRKDGAIHRLSGKADQGENCPAVGEGSYSLTAPADPP